MQNKSEAYTSSKYLQVFGCLHPFDPEIWILIKLKELSSDWKAILI